MQLIYVSNGNDASDNGCYIFAGFKVLFSVTGMTMPVTLLQVFRCYFLLLVCWWIFLYITIMQVPSDCFLLQLCMQLARSFCSTYAGKVTVSAANTVGDKFYCNYADGSLLQLYACGILTLLHFCTPYCCYWWLIMKKRGWKLYHSPNPNPRGVRKCNSAIFSACTWLCPM